MHALVLVSVNMHAKFEVPSHFKDMTGAPKFKKWSRDPDHAPFSGGLTSVRYELLRSPYLPNFKHLATPVTKI